jgi:methyl-accepting chemotaxis protein
MIGGSLLSIAITMFSTQETLTSTFDGSRLVIEKTSLAILPSVVFTNIITTIVVGCIIVVVTLFVSHKIAGPMLRFEKDLKEISQGNLQKTIRLRNEDQFQQMAQNLNDMVQGLNQRLSAVTSELQTISQAAVDQKLPQQFIDDLEECRKKIGESFQL